MLQHQQAEGGTDRPTTKNRISRSRSGDSGVVDNEPGASSAQDSSISSDLADRSSHVVVGNSSLDTENCTFVASNNQPITKTQRKHAKRSRKQAAERLAKEKHEEERGEDPSL